MAELIVTGPGGRRRGSGYRVTRDAVLTAAHVVEGAESVQVRFEPDLAGEWTTAAVSWAADARTDIAVVTITPRPGDEGLGGEGFGRLGDRAGTVDVEAVGFPRWKMRSDAEAADGGPGRYRDSAHVTGSVATLSNWREGTLEVALSSSPAAEPGNAASPWEGMSGAALWAGDRIVGVISRHHPGDGVSTLAAVRVDRVWEIADPAMRQALLDALGLPGQPAGLPVVTAEASAAKPVGQRVHNTIAAPVHGPVVQAGTIGQVHLHGVPARPESWVGEILVGVVMLASLVALIVAAARGQWPTTIGFGLVVAAGVPVLWWLVRRDRRAEAQESVPEEAVAALRDQVRRQWRDERGRRGLQQPRPLQLRWRPTSRPVQVAARGGETALPARQGELLQDGGDHRPPAYALVDAFRQITGAGYRQMVLLGRPGSGKSTLALLFTIAAIEEPDPPAPVPVLLAVSGWDAADEPIEEWIARRISDDHPMLSRRQALLLLKERRILPVLDGLDEIHAERLDEALLDLDRSAGSGLQAVITCRSHEYEQAVRETGALSRAAVVEIDPIDVDSAKTYLEETEIQGSDRWAPVIADMERDPDGRLARLLSTPLMIDLARRVYRKPDSRPRTLTEFRTVEDAEHHLLDQLVSGAYKDDAEREKARRWLAFLAHHLHDRVQSSNLEWWRLAKAVPRWIIAILAAAVTAVAAIPLLVLIDMSGAADTAEYPFAMLVTTILAVAVMVGLHSGRSAHTAGPPARPLRAALGGVWRDLAAFVTAFGAIAAGLLLAGRLIDPRGSDATVTLIVASFQVGRLREGLLVVGGVVVAVSLLANLLNARHGGMPQRSTPRLRTLLPNLAVGTAVGMTVGTPVLVGDGFGDGAEAILTVILLGVFLLPTAFVIGLPLGVALWLTTPDSEYATSSPDTVLRKDRNALLAAVGVTGGVSAVFAGYIAVISDSAERAYNVSSAWPLIAPSYAAAVIVLFGSGNAWMSYTIARLWLAARGRLPWRLLTFLRAAHKAELLRQVGAAYQLRHDRLRTHLAARWTTGRGEPGSAGQTRTAEAGSRREPRRTTRLRTLWRIAAAAAGIGVLVVVARTLYPSHAPRTAAAFALADIGIENGIASSLDGGTIAIAGSEGTAVVSRGEVTRLPAATGEQPAIVALSPDGRLLALSTGDSNVQVWNTRTGERIQISKPSIQSEYVTGLAFGRDGGVLATSDRSSRVQLWDAGTGRPVETFTGITSSVSADEFDGEWQSFAAFSPDLRTMVTYHEILDTPSASRIGRVWDVRSGRLLGTVPGPVCPVNHPVLSCHPTVTSDGRVRMFNPNDGTVEEAGPGRPPRTIDLLGTPVSGKAEISLGPAQGRVAFGPGGRTLLWLLTSGDGIPDDAVWVIEPEVYTWDIEPGR